MMYLVFLWLATMLAPSWAYATFCVYHRLSYVRQDGGHMSLDKLKEATDNFCSYIVLAGFVEMGDNDELVYVDGDEDFWKNIAKLKERPTMKKPRKILVSIGGSNKPNDPKYQRYFEMMLIEQRSDAFINSVALFLKKHDVDGVEIAWGRIPKLKKEESPNKKLKKLRGAIMVTFIVPRIRRSMPPANKPTYEPAVPSETEYTNFISRLKVELEKNKKMLTLGLHSEFVNSNYYNVQDLLEHVNYVILWTIDIPIPAYSYVNAELPIAKGVVQNWIIHATKENRSKLVLGVGTWGRTWATEVQEERLSDKEGFHENTKTSGFWETNEMIVGYDTPQTAKKKVHLVLQNQLGGTGILDIGLDDFNGAFIKGAFPITKAVYYNLHVRKHTQRPHVDSSKSYLDSSKLLEPTRPSIHYEKDFSELPEEPTRPIVPYEDFSELPEEPTRPIVPYEDFSKLPEESTSPSIPNELPLKGTSQSTVPAGSFNRRSRTTRQITPDMTDEDLPLYSATSSVDSKEITINIERASSSDEKHGKTPVNSDLLMPPDVKQRKKKNKT